MELHHEESDVDIRGVFRFAGWLAVVIAVAFVAVWMTFGYFDQRESEIGSARDFPLAAGRTVTPPAPRLQTEPRQELSDLRQREDALLNGYHWVDRDAGVVRIPIAEAMRLTVERGLPVREAVPPAASGGTAR